MTPPKSKVRPHLFQPGPADERDVNGRTACEHCHVLGEPGDARHTMPPPVEDAASRAAGENTRGEPDGL